MTESTMMFGTGTIINCIAIIAGGLFGRLFGKTLKPRMQETMTCALGYCTMFIGISGAMQNMLVVAADGSIETKGTMVLIGSMAIGAFLGEWLDLEAMLERFGEWLKRVTKSTGDAGFVNAFVTASLTVCIGAMAIVGAIQDGIYGDHSILFAKAVLDMVFVAVMTASLGKGCIFSVIPVGLLQGSVTILAVFLKPLLTDLAMSQLSMVGSVMIFCVGVNLAFGKKIRVANLLPALVVAVVWALL